MNAPPRSLEDPAAPRALARLVRGARDDAPSEAELAALTTSLYARVAQGEAASTRAPPRPPARWLARGLTGVVAAGAASLLLVARADKAAPPGPPSAIVARPSVVAPTTPAAVTAPAPSVVPAPSPALLPAPRPVVHPAAAPPVCDPAAHLRAVETARRSLQGGDAPTSLAVVARDRRLCPSGSFAEERDRVEIRALLALGRRDEAARRLERFARERPGSLHLLDLRAQVDNAAGRTLPSRP